MANKKLRKPPEGKKGKGLRKLPKMGFMKDGGLTEATAKLKAQGLKDGGMKIVRGTARGGGAATKGLGYNERPN